MILHRSETPMADQSPVSGQETDEICRILNGILGEGVDVHRCLAAQALGRIGAPAAAPALIAALLDEDEDVRTDAAEALVKLADPGAGQQLLENLLGDPCTEVKLAAMETLAKLGDRQVVPWLIRMLKGRDEEIAWDEEEFYSSGWDDWVDIQVKAVEALAVLKAEEAVPDIVAAMAVEDGQDMTETAFKALARLGRPGIEALAEFLEEDSDRLRRRAATALAGSEAETAAGPLARAFADPSPSVRLAAMRALAARAPGDDRLRVFFADPDAGMRAEAVKMFGDRYPAQLVELLDDGSNAVRVAVLTALANTPDFPADEGLVARLRAGLKDEEPAVATAASRALAAVGGEGAAEDLSPILANVAQPAEVRLGALQGLAMIGGELAEQALVGIIDDDVRPVRLEALSALARLASADAQWPNTAGEALLSALEGGYQPDETGEAEDESAEAQRKPEPAADDPVAGLAVVSDPANDDFPTSTLASILEDTPEAAKAVGLPEEGVELTSTDMERLALAKQIKSKKRVSLAPKVVRHDDIRRFAARVLGDLAQPEAARALAQALSGFDLDTRLAAADSLARVGARLTTLPADVGDTVLAATADADRDMRLPLLRTLATCQGEAVTELLQTHLSDSDPFVRSEAIRALAKQGLVGSKVEALLNDSDPAVRLSAAEAIAGAGGDGAVQALVDFAFSFEGYHGQQAALLLRDLDAAGASALFADVLQDPAHQRIWSVAIAALAEINHSQPVAVS